MRSAVNLYFKLKYIKVHTVDLFCRDDGLILICQLKASIPLSVVAKLWSSNRVSQRNSFFVNLKTLHVFFVFQKQQSVEWTSSINTTKTRTLMLKWFWSCATEPKLNIKNSHTHVYSKRSTSLQNAGCDLRCINANNKSNHLLQIHYFWLSIELFSVSIMIVGLHFNTIFCINRYI